MSAHYTMREMPDMKGEGKTPPLSETDYFFLL